MSLALENGLFGDDSTPNAPSKCSGGNARVLHLKRILYIYVTGLVGRQRRPNPLSGVSRAWVNKFNTSNGIQEPSGWLEVLDRWIAMVEIGNLANQALRVSLRTSQQQGKDANCDAMIHHFSKSLSQWWVEVQSLEGMSLFPQIDRPHS